MDWFQDEPMENLERLSGNYPIYIFYGEKDIQVQPSTAIMAWGAKKVPNSYLYTCRSMTHTLKTDIPGQRLATYSDPDLPLDGDLLRAMSSALVALRSAK